MIYPIDIQAVQQSFDTVTARSDDFAELFYTRLFADYPETLPLFGHVDLANQRKKLFAMMTLVVTHLDRVEVVHPVLNELGRRHVAYGVLAGFYDAFVETFLDALIESLPPEDWTESLAQSWRAALRQLSDVMIAAGQTPAQNESDAIPSDEVQVLMQISGKPEISGAHTRLFTSFLAKRVHDHDLELARDVQRTLLPQTLHAPDGYAIDAIYEPAREVGGDYYDCVSLPDGRLCVAFGDVAGKGVAAAIVMSRLASAMQTTVRLLPDLGAVVANLNDHMCERAWGGRFVTLLTLFLDPVRHVVQVANAGHRAPFLLRADGRVEQVAPEIAGVPVGIIEGVTYEVAEQALEPGDVLLLFTDGIDESRSPSGDFYGIERLQTFLENTRADAATVATAVLDEIHAYSAGRPPSDDIAILTITREG